MWKEDAFQSMHYCYIVLHTHCFCAANVNLPAETLTSRPFPLQHPDMKGLCDVSIAEVHGRTWRAVPALQGRARRVSNAETGLLTLVQGRDQDGKDEWMRPVRLCAGEESARSPALPGQKPRALI